MKAIREAGIPLKRSIRLILGCDEESDWKDMEYYGTHERIPDIGFSPDAMFPLINTEKGMVVLSLRAPEAVTGLKIMELSTGDRINDKYESSENGPKTDNGDSHSFPNALFWRGMCSEFFD